MELIIQSIQVSILSMGVIFLVLGILIVAIRIMVHYLPYSTPPAPPAKAPAPAAASGSSQGRGSYSRHSCCTRSSSRQSATRHSYCQRLFPVVYFRKTKHCYSLEGSWSGKRSPGAVTIASKVSITFSPTDLRGTDSTFGPLKGPSTL